MYSPKNKKYRYKIITILSTSSYFHPFSFHSNPFCSVIICTTKMSFSRILVSRCTDLFNIGHQFTDLGIKTFFCLLLKLGKISFKVSFFPVLFPFSIQCSLRNDRSIVSRGRISNEDKQAKLRVSEIGDIKITTGTI